MGMGEKGREVERNKREEQRGYQFTRTWLYNRSTHHILALSMYSSVTTYLWVCYQYYYSNSSPFLHLCPTYTITSLTNNYINEYP